MGLRMWWDDWLVVFGLRIWRDLYNESLLTFLHSDPSIASIHSTLRSQNGADISRCLGTERHPEHSLPGAIRWSANYTDYTPCRTWIQHFFLLIATHGWQWLTTLCFFAGSSAKNKGQLSSVMFSLSLAILLSKHTYFHVFLLFSIPESWRLVLPQLRQPGLWV